MKKNEKNFRRARAGPAGGDFLLTSAKNGVRDISGNINPIDLKFLTQILINNIWCTVGAFAI